MAFGPCFGAQMKTPSRFMRSSMQALIFLLCAVGLVGAGCKKKETSATKIETTPPPATPAVEAVPEAAASPGEAVPTAATPATTNLTEFQTSIEIADLTKELQIFIFQKHRLPADLAELS